MTLDEILSARIRRCVSVENILLTHVKNKTTPSVDECRQLAYDLGVPEEHRKAYNDALAAKNELRRILDAERERGTTFMNERDHLRARVAELERNAWQPMETAPKDRKIILGFERGYISGGYWSNTYQRWVWGNGTWFKSQASYKDDPSCRPHCWRPELIVPLRDAAMEKANDAI